MRSSKIARHIRVIGRRRQKLIARKIAHSHEPSIGIVPKPRPKPETRKPRKKPKRR